MTRKKIDLLINHLNWIASHGGDLAGYVARYGAADDPNRYGDGGAAIYAADMAALAAIDSKAPAIWADAYGKGVRIR